LVIPILDLSINITAHEDAMTSLVKTFPSVPTALKALDKLRGEVRNAKTLAELASAAKSASDIQRRFKPIKEVADKAGQIRIEADLRLAEELDKLPKARGTRGQLRGSKHAGPGRGKKGKTGKPGGSLSVPPGFDAPTYAEMGLDKKWAARSKALNRIPKDDREAIAEQLSADSDDVTPKNILKVWKEQQREAKRKQYVERAAAGGKVSDLQELIDSGQRFANIGGDPPWSFDVYSGKGKQRSAERHYDTMDLDAIKALPIGKLAAEDCALFLWIVWPELPGALEVIKAWGFEYKTVGFTWVKTTKGATQILLNGDGLHWGMGYWTRANTEVCLLATRGSPMRLAMDVHQVIVAPVGRHSEKPEETYKRIERLVPGPRLELFGRSKREGWTVWGNEIGQKKEAAE
jgi:N6-adenosine-specific RNA methylase IME4